MGARASVPADPAIGTPPRPLRPKPRRASTTGILEQAESSHVVILVLGDVGRSPRMQYHAMSLASHGVEVTLLGYAGERCIAAVEDSPRVDTSRRFAPPLSGPWGKSLRRRSYLLFVGVKAVALLGRIMFELLRVGGRQRGGSGAGAGFASKPTAILVQNPPSLPGLACVYLACLWRQCAMVLDWHNLGFTMFDRGPRHPLVWITRKAEAFFGRQADVNLTVSHAMRSWIQENFGVPEAYIVYDQPPDFFRAPTIAERHKLFARLESTNDDFSEAVRALTAASSLGEPGATGSGTGGDDWWPDNDQHDGDDATARRHPKKARGAASRVTGGGSSSSDSHDRGAGNVVVDATATSSNSTRAAAVPGDGDGRGKAATIAVDGEERTLFTRRSAEGVCELRRDRPALLLSSTSWTPDEDFSVLLEALRRFDSRAVSGASPTLPLVMVVVTGKGPDKAKYVERMRKARMSKVAVCTAWLEPEDYPVLLGSADLGVCLHTSTSGVDLPMKVVDMFGCGVPVCAVHFQCLRELVQDGYNGCVFKDSTQLALQLEALLDGFPRGGCELDGYRSNLKEVKRWQGNWDEFAWPLFAKLGRQRFRASSSSSNSSENNNSNSNSTTTTGSGGGGRGQNRWRGGGGEGWWSASAAAECVVVPAVLLLVLLFSAPWLSNSLECWIMEAAVAVERWGRRWT